MQPRASEEFARERLSDRNPPHQDTTCVNQAETVRTDQTLLQIFLDVVDFRMSPAGGRGSSAIQLGRDVQLL